MDIMNAIKTRRSIGRVKPDPVEQEKIEKILEAGTMAPNHFHTEPWRFFVMTGEGRKVLARGLAEAAADKQQGLSKDERAALYNQQETKAFRAPVVITVAADVTENDKALRTEELAACHAAVQNMLLTAHSLGLAAIWRTGAPAYHPAMKQAFGLQDKDEIVGFVYMGYSDMEDPVKPRASFQEKTVWLNNAE